MLKKCFGQNNLSKFSNLRKISTGNKTPIAFHKKLMMSSSFCDSSPWTLHDNNNLTFKMTNWLKNKHLQKSVQTLKQSKNINNPLN